MQSKAEVTPGDQQLMLTAASLGVAEIGLGKPPSDSGASADVRSFGQRMVANILASARASRSSQTAKGFGF
jgi:putative membrane protein